MARGDESVSPASIMENTLAGMVVREQTFGLTKLELCSFMVLQGFCSNQDMTGNDHVKMAQFAIEQAKELLDQLDELEQQGNQACKSNQY